MKSDVVEIGNTEMLIKEYNGQRVVTFKDIDTVHQRPTGTARKTFNRNRKRFEAGKHYFVLKTDEETRKNPNVRLMDIRNITVPNRGITVLTERGYLMLVKAFTDDLSWQVQDRLVEVYFKAREQQQEKSEGSRLNYNNPNDTTTTPAPRNISWYSRNVWKFDGICKFLSCDYRYLIGRLVFLLKKEFDIDRACLIYELEKGVPPRYILDVVGYFDDISKRAEEVIDTLYYGGALQFGTLENMKKYDRQNHRK